MCVGELSVPYKFKSITVRAVGGTAVSLFCSQHFLCYYDSIHSPYSLIASLCEKCLSGSFGFKDQDYFDIKDTQHNLGGDPDSCTFPSDSYVKQSKDSSNY